MIHCLKSLAQKIYSFCLGIYQSCCDLITGRKKVVVASKPVEEKKEKKIHEGRLAYPTATAVAQLTDFMDGVNLNLNCENPKCSTRLENRSLVVPAGFGTIYLSELFHTSQCSQCDHPLVFEDKPFLVFRNCAYSYRGRYTFDEKNKIDIAETNQRTGESQLAYIPHTKGRSYYYLTMEVSKLG